MEFLTVGLTQQGIIDTKEINRFQVGLELKKYKTEQGLVNYPKLFNIPVENRLPALAKKDLGMCVKMIAVAVTMAMETMNLTRPMNGLQIVDLSEEIVDSLVEGDNLSLEDFMLFLQKLTRGEYGIVYEGIDKMKFMTFFSKYRDERWEAAKDGYYEQHDYYKNLGDKNREKNDSDNPLDIHLSTMTQKVEQLKDQLKEQKDINKRLREDF